MIYLDNSATSNYKPKEVKKAVINALSNPVNVGRTANKKAFLYSRKIYETRERICNFIGGEEPESVIFTNNATTALNFATKGILKNENNHIITTYMEHNSVLRQIYSHPDIDFSFLPCKADYTVDVAKISSLIKDNTSLIIINCASNVTGSIADWKLAYEIANKNNIPVLFDFSQAVGNIPVNLTGYKNIMVAFSGHKSLLGPQGTGVLYISPELKLRTVFEGGTGSMSNELVQPEILPDRFESGTLNTPGILGLNEGVKFVEKVSVLKIREKKIGLCQILYEKLKNMNGIKIYHNGIFFDKVPLISFNIGDCYSDEIMSILANEYNIAVRGGYHCAPLAHKVLGTQEQGTIRVSPGYKTTKKDIIKFIDSIHRITKQKIKISVFDKYN